MKSLLNRPNIAFRSKEKIGELPLVHINIGNDPDSGEPLVAKGIVAIGNVAIGVVSLGAASVGVVAIGAFGLGIVSLSSIALGLIALGAVAIGYEYAIGVAALSKLNSVAIIDINLQFALWTLIFSVGLPLLFWVCIKSLSKLVQN